jgi:MFS family permease
VVLSTDREAKNAPRTACCSSTACCLGSPASPRSSAPSCSRALPLPNLALTAALAWAMLGAFRFPLGLAETPVVAAVLLAMTGFTSALTDIPLIALAQQRIPDRHLAQALGLWEAGIAGALAVAPFVAATTINQVGVRSAFMLSGAALIALAAIAAITLTRATTGSARRAAVAAPLAPLHDGHGT